LSVSNFHLAENLPMMGAAVCDVCQLIPARIRALQWDAFHYIAVQLIFGARQLFVARHLNSISWLKVEEITNQAASIQ